MKKLLFLFPLLLIGCASFNYRITGWYNEDDEGSNQVILSNGKKANIVGNPRITCFTKEGKQLADGLFVRIDGRYLIVDEFGKDFKWVANGKAGNYCTLWEQK